MSTIHAWDCPCGTRNAPSLVECRNCKRPQSAGQAVYPRIALKQPAPPVVASPVLAHSPPARTLPLSWIGAACAILLVFVILPFMGKRSQEQNAPKLSAAMTAFQAQVGGIASEAPGVFVSTFILDGEPNITISDLWYQAPRYLKERLVDRLGARWQQDCKAAGLEHGQRLNFRDVNGRIVAVHRPAMGTQILLE